MSDARRRQSFLRSGCPLSFFREGAGPPVVWIQGVAIGAKGWDPQVDALRSEFDCLAFDNRGFGRSQPCEGGLTVEQMAEDTLALMEAQGWSDAHLVAHSLGGLVALQMAKQAQARVRSLALLCTFVTGKVPTRLAPKLLGVSLRTVIGTAKMRRRAFLELVMPPEALAGADLDAMAARLAEFFEHDLAGRPPVAMKQFRATGKSELLGSLSAIRDTPTLVVSARHDLIAPPSAGRAIAEGIAGAKFVELEDASHGVTLQQPERINAMLREHLLAAERDSVARASRS